jgi:choline dehydrogenase
MSDTTYDYIIVGAGSSGCVLANRLSADPANRVLLLEAGGPDRNPWIHIPIGYYRTMHDPALTWGYQTDPDPGIGGRRIVWPRGRVLGGSSSINGLVYIRGQREDYDQWRQMGNAGWSYDDVLPLFRRAEDQERGEDDLHGTGGPLKVSDIRDRRPICDALIEAAAQIGIPRNDDFNGATQEGAGYFQTTSRDRRRCSSAVAYLKPARRRPNLEVRTHALACRVLFEDGRATGVAYLRGGREEKVLAGREVILSGGAINSPQLLQLSGVGPPARLRELGIDVVLDAPGVGTDLQDHFQVRAIYELNKSWSVNDEVNSIWRRLGIGLRYVLGATGPMTFSAGAAGAFTRTRSELAAPDVQYHFIPFSAEGPGQGLHPFPGVLLSVCQLRPESRGEILIRSPDPREHPSIRPNYLDTELDRRTIVAGMRIARRMSRAPAFAQHLLREREPGESLESDEELLDFARTRGNTIFHPTSTCRMGQDERAVVDERLRVHGLRGLRVADCSIMPGVVSGNTNAPAIMIGEKASDMVLEDRNRG